MSEAYDVFISFKSLGPGGSPSPDSQLAATIYEFLTARRLRVFFSTISLEMLGISAYKKAIDNALDAARVLVAVGSSAENLNSEWVRYEWDSFYNDILSGVKPEGRVFVYLDGVAPSVLPRALRQSQAIGHGPGSLDHLYSFIINAIGVRSEEDAEACRHKQVPNVDNRQPRSDTTDRANSTARTSGDVIPVSAGSGLTEEGKPKTASGRWAPLAGFRQGHRLKLWVILLVVVLSTTAVLLWLARRDPLGEMRRKEIEREVSLLLLQSPTVITQQPSGYQEVESFETIDYSSYQILSDDRIVDLRMWKEIVPEKLHEPQESISVTRRVRLKKIKPANEIVFEGRTSGLDLYWKCLSPYQYRVVGQKSVVFVGQDRMKARRILVDVSGIPVNDEFELRLIATFWNSLQTEREQWFGLIGYEGAFKASQLLLFPREKPFKTYALITARSVRDQPVPYDGPKILLSGEDRNWLYWEVPGPEAGRVYKLHWTW